MTSDEIEKYEEDAKKAKVIKAEIDENRFASNSLKTKGAPEKKVRQVVKGRTRKRKKSPGKIFKETFVAEDALSVVAYIFYEVLVPAAKNTISDMISGGIERLLYGDEYTPSSRQKPRSKYGPQVTYGNYYGGRPKATAERPRSTVRVQQSFDNIVLDRRADADEVLTHLAELIASYGQASVADLYDLVGIPSNFVDQNFGWEDLGRAGVARTRDGWVLNLPKPIDL